LNEPVPLILPEFYTFSYSLDGKLFTTLGKVNTNLISTETAGGFTGVFLGLFASGNGKASLTPAEFDWFDYAGK
jgi:alpha-N-arabinofuranosidase